MRDPTIKLFSLVVALGLAAGATAATPVSPAIQSALADPARPQADRDRDAARKAGEALAFAGLKPGQKVADYLPGAGYFSRIFSAAVGPKGHVYAIFPDFMAKFETREVAAMKALAADPHYANVSLSIIPAQTFDTPEKLDLIWTSQNYHDLQFGLSHEQIVALDKAILADLKPGGIFLVIDHVAAPGTGWTVARTLHRIEPKEILADMKEAGFKLVGQSDMLRNPADPHDKLVFDPSIRGHTDQVVFKFQRPK